MTITIAPSRNEYTSNAGQTIFNYTFKIFENTDLNVYITPAGQDANDSTDLTTAYTVSGVGNEAGGSITLSTPINANDLVTIVSNVPSSRTTDYQNNGDFRPDTVNADFDRVVSIAKKIEDTANRTVLLEQSQQDPKPLTLENPEAGRLVRWKGDLTGLENFDLVSSSLVASGELVIYATVAAMKADASGVLVAGMNVETQGYYASGDAGAARYLIVAPQAADGFGDHVLANGNIAVLQHGGSASVAYWGAKGDNVADDTPSIQAALNSIGRVTSSKTAHHKITHSLLLSSNTEFNGQGCSFTMNFANDGSAFISASYATANTPTEGVVLKNFTLNGLLSGNGENGIGLAQAHNWVLDNIIFRDIDFHAVDMGGSKSCVISNCKTYDLAGAAFQFDSLDALGTVFALDTDGTTSIPNAFDAGAPSWTETEYCKVQNCFMQDCFIGIQYHRGILRACDIIDNTFLACTRGIVGDDAVTADLTKIEGNTFNNCPTAARLANYSTALIFRGNTIKGPTDGNTSGVFAYGLDLFKNSTAVPRDLIISNNTFRQLQIPLKLNTYTDGVIEGNSFFDCSNKAPGAGIGSCATELVDCSNIIINANKYNSCLDCGIFLKDSVASSVNLSITNNQFRQTRNSIRLDNIDSALVNSNNVSSFNWAGAPIHLKDCIRSTVSSNRFSTTGTNTGGILFEGTIRSFITANRGEGTSVTTFVLDGCNDINTADNDAGWGSPTPSLHAKNTSTAIKSSEGIIPVGKVSSDGTSSISLMDTTYTTV